MPCPQLMAMLALSFDTSVVLVLLALSRHYRHTRCTPRNAQSLSSSCAQLCVRVHARTSGTRVAVTPTSTAPPCAPPVRISAPPVGTRPPLPSPTTPPSAYRLAAAVIVPTASRAHLRPPRGLGALRHGSDHALDQLGDGASRFARPQARSSAIVPWASILRSSRSSTSSAFFIREALRVPDAARPGAIATWTPDAALMRSS